MVEPESVGEDPLVETLSSAASSTVNVPFRQTGIALRIFALITKQRKPLNLQLLIALQHQFSNEYSYSGMNNSMQATLGVETVIGWNSARGSSGQLARSSPLLPRMIGAIQRVI